MLRTLNGKRNPQREESRWVRRRAVIICWSQTINGKWGRFWVGRFAERTC